MQLAPILWQNRKQKSYSYCTYIILVQYICQKCYCKICVSNYPLGTIIIARISIQNNVSVMSQWSKLFIDIATSFFYMKISCRRWRWRSEDRQVRAVLSSVPCPTPHRVSSPSVLTSPGEDVPIGESICPLNPVLHLTGCPHPPSWLHLGRTSL